MDRIAGLDFFQQFSSNTHFFGAGVNCLQAKNWGVHAKLIYKYQILYLDCITIFLWRHLVNDIDLCRSPKSPKYP